MIYLPERIVMRSDIPANKIPIPVTPVHSAACQANPVRNVPKEPPTK